MRKYRYLVSVLLLVAVVLSACGGANNSNSTPGANTTPGAGENETPVTGGEVDVTPTLAVTDMVETSPTVEATVAPTTDAGAVDATATPAEGAAVDTTPTSEVPVTGVDEECNPYLLRNYLEMEVVDNTGNLIGEVDGIVIYRDAALGAAAVDQTGVTGAADATATPGAGGGAADATATPAAGAADATPTTDAAGGTGAGAGALNAADYGAPMVAYVVLDLDDASEMGDQDVLVPFSALTAPEANLPVVAGGTGDNTGAAGTGTDNPTATQAAGEAAATPTAGVDDQGNIVDTACVVTFNGEMATLTGAPLLENDNWPDFTTEGWDEEFNTYWTTNGVSADFTGPNGETMGSPVVLRDGFEDIDVENANGDDIGEIEDFVIDSATGRFQYAVLAAGGFLGIGEKYIPVPVNQVLWGNFDDDVEDMGEVVVNVPEDAWENAPSFDDLNVIDFTTDAWHSDVDTFWVDMNPAQ